VEPTRTDESPKHPAAHRLDAVAAGDADEGVTAHLAACEACTRHVEELRGEAARYRAAHDANAFVARAQAAAHVRVREPEREPEREGEGYRRTPRASWVVRVGVVAAPLLAAALVLLLVRARPGDGGGAGPSVAARAGEGPSTGPAAESRFKGGLVVAVVRERGGRQERLAGPFQVRAGDRVRVEVSTDRDGPLAAGLLTDEGEWVTLLAPVALEAGTHYSELAARFDESPTRATLLVGDPEDVARARASRDFARVLAWRVTSEAAP
jgi:hypothetical protein